MGAKNYRETNLETGSVRIYDFEDIALHAYQTNDPLSNEVFVVEKNGRGFVIEYPCFRSNIVELETYLTKNSISIEGIVASYHMAGASFLSGTPVYATKEASEYGHAGGGKALIDGFAATFGSSFDSSVAKVTNIIEGNTLTLAGVNLLIARNNDAFDIELPQLGAVYLHMMGHDCHSIVGGAAHADALIAQLQGFLEKDISLVLTSHYTPEEQKDVRAKIAYLKDLKALAAASENADDFKHAVEEKYPAYAGQNYLEMTCGFFFGD